MSDWFHGYYEYANRMAHLHFLPDHEIDASLVGVLVLPVAALFAFVSSFAVATVATGVGLTEFLTDVSEALRWSDLLGALRVLGVNAGLFGVTWWFAMAALVRSRGSLRAKLAVTFVGVLVIQLLLNLML